MRWKCCVLLYKNGKIRPVETNLVMGGRGKEE
jgi:hypothetical protein